ncbi:MAG TPA: Stk1 family PASTA domain-containing Ser/Thr kinase [Bacillota bacterium]|nr:Stk1 family PASTA domain-containing Ser/Thr kinase [Bacillota bacterium]
MDYLGQTLSRRYELVEQLGGGGMALVYRGRDRFLNREVTVKILRPQYTSDEKFVERFRREAQAVACLSSPNLVSVYDVGEEHGTHFIVMEYIEGQNLKEVIRERGKLPLSEAVSYARQICEGLEQAHEKGIVHRDIKPHNILVTKSGRVKVTDFGIAKAITSDTVTQAGTIMGSVHYIAPEQVKGEQGGVRSDIYSVGVVLYEMITGQVPFEGETPIAMAMKHIQEDPNPPSCLRPEINQELEKVILRAMAKTPDKRYQTAREMATDLATVLSGEISPVTRLLEIGDCQTIMLDTGALTATAKDGPASKRSARKRRRLIVGGVLLLLVLLGAFLGFGSLLSPAEVTMPNLIGSTVEQAKTNLEPLKLKLKVREEQFHEKQPAGEIFFQDPDPGLKVKEGREIEVIVSKGPKLYPMPNLVGKTMDEAKLLIEQSQMTLGKPTELFDENIPAGTVISQNPDPATSPEQPQGTVIELWVSKGPQPRFIAVPNVIGMTEKAAREALAAVKLDMQKEADIASSDFFAGMIAVQKPAAGPGQSIEEGSKVTVQVSKGPGPEAKGYELRYQLEDDSQVHHVRVIIRDAKDPQGRTEFEEDRNGGEQLVIPVKVYGSGSYELSVDERIVQQGPIQ